MKEQYTAISGKIFESDFQLNMYRLVPPKPITHKTIKLERHEE